MPVSVFHALTATTPDDPSAEIRPQAHWNAAHAVSLSATNATEIYGAFSNDPSYNVSFTTIAGNKIVASANVTAAPSPVNITGANGSSVNAQTLAFSNSNGLTLGVSTAVAGATVTGSYTVPSTAGLISAVNVSAGTTSGNQTALVFSNSNGVSFGLNAGTITATVKTDYLTTAAQSNQVVNSVNGSTGAISFATGSSLSSSQNGSTITWGLASNITTALQSAGAYLTTARASNDAIGLNSAVSNVTATINSSGLSLDARGYAGTGTAITGGAAITLNSGGLSFNGASLAGTSSGFTGANISASITHNTAGLAMSMSVAAGGGGFTGGVSTGGNTSGQTGTQTGQIVFAGGNNITLSVATAAGGNQTITISGANAGGAQTGISGIIVSDTTYTSGTVSFSNANGISFGSSAGQAITASYTVPSTAGLISRINVSAGTTSNNLSALTFADGNGISFGLNASTVTASHNALTSQSNQNVTAANGGFAFQTLSFSNVNGISFGTSAGSAITASHNALTTARASNDAIGLNTAQSNVTWTVNSSGLSLDARGYAGTGTSATNASITLNSNGLAISVAAGGGVTPVASASNGSFSFTTLNFSNANNVTFGTSAGSIITASVAAPGAAAENNNINLLGANTAGNTTASGSTIGWSGINVTLSGTNGSVVNISAPATSSLSATGLVSISTNGSTISIGAALLQASTWMPVHPNGSVSLAPIGNGSVQVVPAFNADPFSVSRGVVYISNSVSSSSNSSHAGALSLHIGFYTRNGSTLSLASSGSQSYQWTNTSNNSLASVSGHRGLTVPINVNYTGGDLWMAYLSVSSTTNANWFTARNVVVTGFSNQMVGNIGENTANSKQVLPGWGHFSATSGALPGSIAFSQINGQGSNNASVGVIPIIGFANYTA